MKLVQLLTTWDRKGMALCAITLLSALTVFAQQKLPIITATSGKVDVRDGEVFQKAVWNLSPDVKPDVYYALEPVSEKRITFYTDTDSISFNVVAGKKYDFLIVLNNTDTCYTRISTMRTVKETEVNTVSLKPMEEQMLKQDFTIFRKALQNEHAGLYRYKGKREMDRLFDSCFVTLNHSMTALEFGKSIMFLISSIEDGHTGTNIPRLLMNYYPANEKMFPLQTFFIHNKAYVLCSNARELPAATEILAIDNVPIGEIKNTLLRYLPSDGKIVTKKNQVLNNGAFPFLYRWIFGNKDSFCVQYKTTKAGIKTINIAAEIVKDFECADRNQSADIKPLQLEFPQNNIALLTVHSFDDNRLNGAQQNFNNFLETAFKEMNTKKVNNLIIDIRGNSGGADHYGALLYSYLANKPFKYFASIESTTNSIQLKNNPLLGMQKPQENNFAGKVFFLIDGLCFSTTADFCAIAKSNNRGKFIGEETGGGYYGNTSGGIKNVILPNSKINITIPKFKYVNNVKKTKYKDRGIIPDYPVIPEIEEVIQYKDVQLHFALKLAKEAVKCRIRSAE